MAQATTLFSPRYVALRTIRSPCPKQCPLALTVLHGPGLS